MIEYMEICPEKFKEIYLEVVKLNSDNIMSIWNNSKDFTKLMVTDTKSIIQQIAQKLHLNCVIEYWSIDAVLFENRDNKHYDKNSIFTEYINVAIEHENNASTAHQEINKLSLFNVPLKVLITYSHYNLRTNRLIEEYAEVLRKADIFSDFSTLKKQLVIFGSKKGKTLYWDFYLYIDGNFEQL